MIIFMRTTVMLQDQLFRAAKRRAVERGITFSQLVDEGLRLALQTAERPLAAPAYAIVTFGEGMARVHREPADFAAADDQEDHERLQK
jgi:hypothetical protein